MLLHFAFAVDRPIEDYKRHRIGHRTGHDVTTLTRSRYYIGRYARDKNSDYKKLRNFINRQHMMTPT